MSPDAAITETLAYADPGGFVCLFGQVSWAAYDKDEAPCDHAQGECRLGSAGWR